MMRKINTIFIRSRSTHTLDYEPTLEISSTMSIFLLWRIHQMKSDYLFKYMPYFTSTLYNVQLFLEFSQCVLAEAAKNAS